jgi:hypothetical protein
MRFARNEARNGDEEKEEARIRAIARNPRFFRESGAQSGDWALRGDPPPSRPLRSLFRTPFDFTPSHAIQSMGPSKPRGKRLSFPSKRALRDVAFAQNERFKASFSRDSIPQDRESSFKRV